MHVFHIRILRPVGKENSVRACYGWQNENIKFGIIVRKFKVTGMRGVG
jgi:hypothetical protein